MKSSIPDIRDLAKYTITLYKNRKIKIGRSFIQNGEDPKEQKETEFTSSSGLWLNSATYTGIWIVFYYG
jgi:hypothetical protein